MIYDQESLGNKQIIESLSRICDSSSLRDSPQLCSFLSYVVKLTIEENEKTIKAYTIATQALGRRDDFDPQADPIVRVQARRLRLALEKYYLTEGKNELLVISLGTGSYVPTFSKRKLSSPHPSSYGQIFPIDSEKLSLQPDPALNQYILILNRDDDTQKLLKVVCEKRGFEVIEADSDREFWVAYHTFCPKSIILDIVDPDIDGFEVLRELASVNSNCRIVLTGDMDLSILDSAVTFGTEIGLIMVGRVPKSMGSSTLEAELDTCFGAMTIGHADIEKALKANQFELCYQPKMSLKSSCGGQIFGFEALLRWHHPKKGMIEPSNLIRIAEQTGQINAITNWVIENAIDQLKLWHSKGVNVDISVNIAARDLVDIGLPSRVSNLLENANIPNKRLILEVSQSPFKK